MAASESGSPLRAAADGVRLALRVQPGASRDQIAGVERLADGRTVLKVRLSAPAEGGKANAALVKLLAKSWKLPKSDVELVAGARQRTKTLLVRGDPSALAARLESWLGEAAADG